MIAPTGLRAVTLLFVEQHLRGILVNRVIRGVIVPVVVRGVIVRVKAFQALYAILRPCDRRTERFAGSRTIFPVGRLSQNPLRATMASAG
jgi:hypothetical protein